MNAVIPTPPSHIEHFYSVGVSHVINFALSQSISINNNKTQYMNSNYMLIITICNVHEGKSITCMTESEKKL